MRQHPPHPARRAGKSFSDQHRSSRERAAVRPRELDRSPCGGDCGNGLPHCARSIYFAHSAAKLRLLGEALRNLNQEAHLGWAWITQQQMERCGAKEEDCEGLVNYVLSIGEIEVAAFFRELPDGRYRVSLRSKGQLDVSRVAESFGGGGHQCASGCAVDGPLTEAVRQILSLLRGGPSVQ